MNAVFSNGTEWEIWSYNWCHNCTKDSEELVDQGKGCPHILTALIGEKPKEWTEVDMGWYECSDFEEREETD